MHIIIQTTLEHKTIFFCSETKVEDSKIPMTIVKMTTTNREKTKYVIYLFDHVPKNTLFENIKKQIAAIAAFIYRFEFK